MLVMKRSIGCGLHISLILIGGGGGGYGDDKTYNICWLLAFQVLSKGILVFVEVDTQIKTFYLFCDNNNNMLPGLHITPLMIDIKSLNIFEIKILQNLIFMYKTKTS